MREKGLSQESAVSWRKLIAVGFLNVKLILKKPELSVGVTFFAVDMGRLPSLVRIEKKSPAVHDQDSRHKSSIDILARR